MEINMETPLPTLHLLEMMIFIMAFLAMVNLTIESKLMLDLQGLGNM